MNSRDRNPIDLVDKQALLLIDQHEVLAREAYSVDTVDLARSVVGKYLFYRGIVLRITEVEAYRGASDPGSHAYRSKTKRNAPMFGSPGHLYVYISYGMHNCINIVADTTSEASGILIRSGEQVALVQTGDQGPHLEPRVQNPDIRSGARGPGRLGRLVGAKLADSGYDLCDIDAQIFLFQNRDDRLCVVGSSTRIGLGNGGELPWRFFDQGSDQVSNPRAVAISHLR